MVLFKGTKLFSTLFVLLIVFCATNEAKPPIFQNLPTCPGCQKRDVTGTCQNTNTILNDGKCYYLDNSRLHFDMQVLPNDHDFSGYHKKDVTEKYPNKTTVLAKDGKYYYTDISMPYFYAGVETNFDLEFCPGCQKIDKYGVCQNTATIFKDDKCHYLDPTMPAFDAVPNTVVCLGCQRRDMMGTCQNTNTILKDDICYYLDPGMPAFDALFNSLACPRCQRRDMSGVCQNTTTVLTEDGKCYYFDPYIQPSDAPPDSLFCPGCQKRDEHGICRPTETVLADGKCYYIYSRELQFDADSKELSYIETSAKSDVFMDLPACPGCQMKDVNGICRPTATVLRGDKCYYSDPHIPPFDAAKPSHTPQPL